MRIQSTLQRKPIFPTVMVAAVLFLVAAAAIAFAHGGKHAQEFTHLAALQKGTELYDELIGMGKLDESWEAGLVNVAISNRSVESGEEIVVAFQRETGDPSTVYIYFNMQGEYVGSNFSGE